MEYEDGYDDGYDDGVKAAKKATKEWSGWGNLSEVAFALNSQLSEVQGSSGYAAKFTTTDQPTYWFTAGQTLVALKAAETAAVDLNSLAWDNVAPATSQRLKTTGADYIQFRDGKGTVGNMIRYFYLADGGWGLAPTQARKYPELVADGKAFVPAGTVFWYYRNPSAEGSASMTTEPAEEPSS